MSATKNFSTRRIFAMILRYTYILRSSWPRIIELAYWPTVQMILWGLITTHLLSYGVAGDSMTGNGSWLTEASGLFLAAVLLWDVLFRGQLGVSLPFFEEMYSRNLGHLFVSPLRPHELILALFGISFLRTIIGISCAALLAIPLFHFSIFDLGLPLIAFFTNLLITGWALGLIIAALVLRYGLGAESLAWAATFALAPISGIYYPIKTLPEWLQPVAMMLPSSHSFEGMRAVMIDSVFRYDLFLYASALNVIYLIIAFATFMLVFKRVRQLGLLLNAGE